MNEDIHCIANKGKMVKNEWKMLTPTIFLALYSVYKKLEQFFFHTLLANLFKQRYNVLLQIF